MNFNNWRDCQEWKSEGLPMNTTSNEACKLFDVTLSQLIGWYENYQYGGIEGCLNKMIETDPNFVLGHVLKNGINLIGSSVSQSLNINSIKDMIDASNKISNNLSEREVDHVEAIKHLYNGNLHVACDYWEKILIDHPTDLMALKFAHDTYFYLGYHAQMRDSVARVLPKWSSNLPYYSYLYGLHSFGLTQTNFFNEAKKAAMTSLEMNRNDGWATHSICHYNEYLNDFDGGIKFLRDTEKDWSICDLIASHNYWHLALYHIERDEHQAALDLFDQNISTNLNYERTLDMVDLVSLLVRLKLDCGQVNLKDRWSLLREAFIKRINDHGYTFNDAHVLLIANACDDTDSITSFFKSLNEYLDSDVNQNYYFNSMSGKEIVLDENSKLNLTNSGFSYMKMLNKNVGANLFNSICYFNQGDFSKVVDLLNPIRYELVKIGGSNAQRDLFNQILVQSALRSDNKFHNKLGLALLNERSSLKPKSNLNKRIYSRFASAHYLD